MRGRPPKLAVVKRAEGNLGRRTLRVSVEAAGKSPKCPAGLDAAAKTEWRRVLAVLPGVICAADQAVLATYCQSYARWLEAEAAVAENGSVLVLRNDKGEVKSASVSPFVAVSDKYRQAALRAAIELGLTPAARGRLTANDALGAAGGGVLNGEFRRQG